MASGWRPPKGRIRTDGPRLLTSLLVGGLVLLGFAADQATDLPVPPLTAETVRVFPTPQSTDAARTAVPLRGRVVIDQGPGTDAAALEIVRQAIDAAGGTVEAPGAAVSTTRQTVVYIGTPADNPHIGPALAAMDVDGSEALDKAEGYVLAAGLHGRQRALVLAGHDQDGVYHAAQTLRQVTEGSGEVAVVIKDWPLMGIRGVVEGFYGFPWTHQARLDQLEFYGRQKLNTYMYSPKNDPLLRHEWRQQYSGPQLAELSELIQSATRNHVRFVYALSPGLDICYSDRADLESAVVKLQSLHQLGVRTFNIALDDIELVLKCPGDVAANAEGERGLAAAQAGFLNSLNREFVQANPDVNPLEMVPTKFHGVEADPYREELSAKLDTGILVQWTGLNIVSPAITSDSAAAARTAYGTPEQPRIIFLWDNYPVNDFAPDRLFLGPVVGRNRDLHTVIQGITANPMVQSYASMPALASFADYMWNGPGSDADVSLDAALEEIAGPDKEVQAALKTFADLSRHWPIDEQTAKSPLLTADMEEFWRSYEDGTFDDSLLERRAAILSSLPEVLQRLSVKGFYDDAINWIDSGASYGNAVQGAITMLAAVERGDDAAVAEARSVLSAAVDRANQATQSAIDHPDVKARVGDGLFEAFLDRAIQESDRRLEEKKSGS
ncbi:beta-N-acetylglucosaminidase domain-containing protein [Arthrobacter sp. D1-29]